MDEEILCENLVVAHSPKRVRGQGRDDEVAPHMVVKSSAQVKRLRKAKTHSPMEKDRTRGRYACLGHRMKHKRCPLDCPERRPKPNQDLEVCRLGNVDSPLLMQTTSVAQIKRDVNSKPRLPRASVPKKHVLQLEEYNHSSLVPVSTPISERDTPHWDSVEWEGLGWDAEHVCLKETEAWNDLKSSSHWEESKSQVLPCEDSKPTDDLTKFEEDEIIDSWLNDDGFGNSAQEDYESAERNEGKEGNASGAGQQRDTGVSYSSHYVQTLPRILVTRDMLGRWINEPYFNSLVQGCFVRVKIGEYMDNPVYRIAYVREVHDSCFNNNMSPAKGLSLQVGDAIQVFPIAAVSNQSPTDLELRNWHGEMEKANVVFSQRDVQQKEEVLRLLAFKYPEFRAGPQHVEPMINEPVWNC
jgi:hypothetical protein